LKALHFENGMLSAAGMPPLLFARAAPHLPHSQTVNYFWLML
jgi:hypothetical protein